MNAIYFHDGIFSKYFFIYEMNFEHEYTQVMIRLLAVIFFKISVFRIRQNFITILVSRFKDSQNTSTLPCIDVITFSLKMK